MKSGLRAWLRTQLATLLAENDRGLAQERRGWDNYIADIYAAHYQLHDQRRHDQRKQQWKNYERRGK